MLEFDELLEQAKAGGRLAAEELLWMYRPMLIREAVVNGRFEEDLYQELCITLLKCIRLFRIP